MEPTTDLNSEAADFCAGRFELEVAGVALRLLCVREFFIQNFNHETHLHALAYQQSFECLRT